MSKTVPRSSYPTFSMMVPVLDLTMSFLVCLWGLAGLDDWPWSVAMLLTVCVVGRNQRLDFACAITLVLVSTVHLWLTATFLLPGDLLLPVAAFFMGKTPKPAWRRVGLLFALLPVAALVAHAAWHQTIVFQTMLIGIPVLAVQCGGWAFGRWQGSMRLARQEADLRRRVTERDNINHARLSAMEERQRITREMHDILAHSLTAIMVQAESGRTCASDQDSRLVFAAIKETARESIVDVRSLLDNIDEQSIEPEPGVGDITTMIKRFRIEGLNVAYAHTGDASRVPPGLGLSVYRVVEECLTNALRHGSQRKALLILSWGENEVTLSVENPVDKTPAGIQKPRTGRGLAAIRQRCSQYGGHVSYKSDNGCFTVHAIWEIPRPQTADANKTDALTLDGKEHHE